MNKYLTDIRFPKSITCNIAKILFSCLIMVSLNCPLQAQFYETGQDPFSVSWKQIRTKKHRLIFPADFEKNARVFATVIDSFYPVSSKYLLKNHKPVSIIFHTQSSFSNGLVVYAPKRMELYTIPPQDNYPQDWIDQLALHETRHVVQLDALNQGLTRLGSFLIGQQAVGAASGLVPRWFLEGDAVYAETVFSSAGRGRSAAFLMPYRTLALSRKKFFHYEKAMLGSYRDYVPDIYRMGYPIVKMMRDSFDSDVFGKGLRYTGRNPYLVFPFGHSLKANTGKNNRQAYEFTFSNWKNIWQNEDEFTTYTHWPARKKKNYTNYNSPVAVTDSVVLVQKWSLSETRRYVLTDKTGKEKMLTGVGSNNADRISLSGIQFTWSENKTDLRWHNRLYSEVMIYDMEKKKKKRLTRKTFYFSPAFSPDGKIIAVIEETPQYTSYLVLLDAVSGKVIRKTPAPEEMHLQHPDWNEENEIFCLAVGASGKSLIKLNRDETWETVIPASYTNISNFYLSGNTIIFAGENKGINNLFSFNMVDSTYYQVTNSRFGAFEPFLDETNNKLYFSEYTPDGYRISYMDWEPSTFSKLPDYSAETVDSGLKKEFNVQSMVKEASGYPVRNYSRLLNSFNIHSWAPAYFNYSVSNFSNPAIHPGFMILSQDLLGTLVSSFGYSYQEGFSQLHANISYKALYPVINWSINAGGPVTRAGGSKVIPVPYNTNIQSTVNVSLPLNFSRGRYASGITPYVEWRHNRTAYFVNSENRYYQGMDYINYGINLYHYTKMATRDIFPRFGFSSFLKLQTTPFEDKIFSEVFAVNFRTYLPGIVKNHSFQVRYAFQFQSPLRYFYSNLISFPAGYLSTRSEELHLLSLSYGLPLIYPDFHVGPLFYLKRIRSNFFYDMGWNSYHVPNQSNIITSDILRSVGTDLIADIHFLRIIFPFQVGARIAYLPDQKSFFTQAIFSVNLVY